MFNVINSDMKTLTVRKYVSPLRQSQAQETRERILEALAALLARTGGEDFSFDALAKESAIERRTLFRHFASKDALFDAFWEWINARLAPAVMPKSSDDFEALAPEVFDGFDAHEGVIRASLHSASGRAMRQRTLAARRTAFDAALREAACKMKEDDAKRFTAIVHLLYSAAAWENLKDYAGLSGRQSGETVSWAIATLKEALTRDR